MHAYLKTLAQNFQMRDTSPVADTTAAGFSSLFDKADEPLNIFAVFFRPQHGHPMGGLCGEAQASPVCFVTGLLTRTVLPTYLAVGADSQSDKEGVMTMTTLSIGTFAIRQIDGLYSLNDLHKAAGAEAKHRPNQFLRLDTTQALAAEINQCADVRSASKVVNGSNNRGTFACKELVYAYAMWISPAFMLQVIRVFDAQQGQAQPQTTIQAPITPNPQAPTQTVYSATQYLTRIEPDGRIVLQALPITAILCAASDLAAYIRQTSLTFTDQQLISIQRECAHALKWRVEQAQERIKEMKRYSHI